MRLQLYPYKPSSRSACMLATKLGCKKLRHVGSRYRPRKDDIIINWGASSLPDFTPAQVLNPDITAATCKLTSFQVFREAGVNIPPFWVDRDVIPDDAFPVMCRTVLCGHSGDGIVIANTRDGLVDAPLYTKYVKKKDEYRIHVIRAEDDDPDVTPVRAFFLQRKARKLAVENPCWQIRNLSSGFVFTEVEYDAVPGCVIEEAYNGILALGLDFGGVDVIYNELLDQAFVLEVNTACGLEDRTAEQYADALAGLALTTSGNVI